METSKKQNLPNKTPAEQTIHSNPQELGIYEILTPHNKNHLFSENIYIIIHIYQLNYQLPLQMDTKLLQQRYNALPHTTLHEQILQLKQLYPEYRGLSNNLITTFLNPLTTSLSNSLKQSKTSFNGQTTPLALSLTSSASSPSPTPAGGISIPQHYYIFQNNFLLPVLMRPGRCHSKDLRIRLISSREFFKLQAVIKPNGVDVQVTALSKIPKIGEIEIRSKFEKVCVRIEGFGDEKSISRVKLGVEKRNWVKREISDQGVESQNGIGIEKFVGVFEVSGEVIGRWEVRAGRYNEVYGGSM